MGVTPLCLESVDRCSRVEGSEEAWDDVVAKYLHELQSKPVAPMPSARPKCQEHIAEIIFCYEAQTPRHVVVFCYEAQIPSARPKRQACNMCRFLLHIDTEPASLGILSQPHSHTPHFLPLPNRCLHHHGEVRRLRVLWQLEQETARRAEKRSACCVFAHEPISPAFTVQWNEKRSNLAHRADGT